MSHYFNYEVPKAALIYDKERYPMGADVITGLLHVHCGKPLKDIYVLDAGCGTGHYTKALIDLGVGKFTLLDASPEMLEIAKEKLQNSIKKGIIDDVIKVELPELPFEDETFDAVLFNAVLHHLDKANEYQKIPNLEKALQNSKRILRQKGVMVILTMLPTALKEAVWFTQIHAGITRKLIRVCPSMKTFLALFKKYGYECVSATNLLSVTSPTMFVNYFDPEGPLKEDWRIGTSMFGVAENYEIKEIKETVSELKQKGILTQFMKSHEKTSEIGMITLLVCVSI